MQVAPYLDTLLLLMVVAAAINDLASRRIPNRLLAAGALGALVLHLLSPAPLTALLSWLGGAALGLLVFLPFYLVRGMAAGDVKMMAAVGSFTGPPEALRIAILAWCFGGVMALAILVAKGRLGMGLRRLWTMLRPSSPPAAGAPDAGSAGSMPYGVAIAAGTVAILVGR